MISVSPWQQLTVQDFVQQFSTAQSLESQVSASKPLEPLIWQHQTVQSFFAELPWIPDLKTVMGEDLEIGLHLSVSQYFQHFQWNAPLDFDQPQKYEMPPVEGTDSLEDFASLF